MADELPTGDVTRLPEWKECAKEMIAKGLTDGQAYSATFFEQWLRCVASSMKFKFAISKIRRALLHKGFYLEGRGQQGKQYVLLDRTANVGQCKRYVRNATRNQQRAVILGSNTRVDDMKPDDRRRIESYTEKQSNKLILMMRADEAFAALPAALRRIKSA